MRREFPFCFARFVNLRECALIVFSQATVEALRWYVYLLVDPADRVPFYVGKGKAQRAFAHAAEATDQFDHPELQRVKHQRILAIQAAGADVQVEILRHGLDSEETAYIVESAAIDLMGHLYPERLLNLVAGHHSRTHGLTSAAELEIRYAARATPNPGVRIVPSLYRSWYHGISAADLEDFTIHWWRLSRANALKAHYVCGVHRKIVRSVYRITGLQDRQPGDRDAESDTPGRPPRRGFVVVPAPEMAHLIGTSVHGLMGENPQWSIKYVDPKDFAARDVVLGATATVALT